MKLLTKLLHEFRWKRSTFQPFICVLLEGTKLYKWMMYFITETFL